MASVDAPTMATDSPQGQVARWPKPVTPTTSNGSCPSGNPSLTSSNSSFAMDNLTSRCPTSNTEPMDEPKRSYSACALSLSDSEFGIGFLERKPYRPFRSNEEYLIAMKEDLAEWLNTLYELDFNAENFLNRLETGVILCRHANSVLRKAREWRMMNGYSPFKQLSLSDLDLDRDVPVKVNALPGTFQARDNVANFINWCRRIRIHECLLFETEDLVARKNEKSFVLCLLEVARYGAKFGLLAPTLVQFEQEIDQELEQEDLAKQANTQPTSPTNSKCQALFETDQRDCFEADPDTPQPQITNNDLESLHEKVVNLLSRCTCPVQFYLEHLSEGKYRIGDSKTLIFVRILRNHVMVRVGGGWDTLEHYLEKHDPCRCRFGHRYSSTARVSLAYNSHTPVPKLTPQMQVTYERPDHAHQRRIGVNSSPVAGRRLIRPNSVTHNLSSFGDLVGNRRASTSSNDSASSLSSASLAPGSDKFDSLPPANSSCSEHSSLSSTSSQSLASYGSSLPDRNNNIKASNNAFSKPVPQTSKLNSPNKKRVLPHSDTGALVSRIPKSKSPSVSSKGMNNSTAKMNLTPAHRLKSTSSLAIGQLGSKIPCLDSTNRQHRASSSHLPTRYSTHNIYLAVSHTPDKESGSKQVSALSGTPPKPTKRGTPNFSRTKQKSSLDLNLSNENFFSLSQIERPSPEPVPKTTQVPKLPYQQHRRHHSSSSLPRAVKSTHNSPYAKRREFDSGSVSPSGDSRRDSKHGAKLTNSKLDAKKRFQGSATSLNSTASTGSGSSSSSHSSLSTVPTATNSSQENVHSVTSKPLLSERNDSYLSAEPKKFIYSDKKASTPSALVEVCSWLERNHMASS